MGNCSITLPCAKQEEPINQETPEKLRQRTSLYYIQTRPSMILELEQEIENQNENVMRDDGIINELDGVKINIETIIAENHLNPTELYEEMEALGEGSFGKVIKVKRFFSEAIRAMKVISKQCIIEGVTDSAVFEEIKILKSLDHPNIIKIFEYFQDKHSFFIIFEYCISSLFSYIQDKGALPEPIVVNIMRQLLSSIAFLHYKNVVHGDIKLENILIGSVEGDDVEVKIIDFGCSKFLKKNEKVNMISGTSYYMAPEVVKGSFDKKSDLWSCGVVMYMLLTGVPPFDGKNDEEIYQKIRTTEVSFPIALFSEISDEAKHLIKKLLERNPDHRLTANELLCHLFFKNDAIRDHQTQVLKLIDGKKIFQNLKEYNVFQKFRQAVYTYIVLNFSPEAEVKRLQHAYQIIDENSDGKVTEKEIKHAYQSFANNELSDDELKGLMSRLDQDSNGYIEFEEFVRATIDPKLVLTEENLLSTFKVLDLDGGGDINLAEIKKLIAGDKNITEEICEKVMLEIGKQPDEKINFQDFKDIMIKEIK